MRIDDELHMYGIEHLHLERMSESEWCLILAFPDGGQKILSIATNANELIEIIDTEA